MRTKGSPNSSKLLYVNENPIEFNSRFPLPAIATEGNSVDTFQQVESTVTQEKGFKQKNDGLVGLAFENVLLREMGNPIHFA